MAVIEIYEDIFESGMQTLVNPCNVAGAAGKGLSLEFRKRVPGFYQRYRELCFSGQFEVTQLWRYKWKETGQQIVSLPTKGHWRERSDPVLIETNLEKLVMMAESLEITSLAIPPLGCGNGGLDYKRDIRPIMLDVLKTLDIDVHIVLGKKKTT